MLPVQRFLDFIEQQELFVKGNRILLAVSGGRDSVLMLHLCKAAGIEIGIAHCNFNLRAEEARRDEVFVKLLAQNFDLPFYVTHFETKKYAETHKISTQMAARTLRYQWFEEIRTAEAYDYIALAQHQNDAIETVLINMLRGTGLSGLHGILPKRDKLIRPLLFLNREEIEQLVQKHQIDFVEDSSNLSTAYTRNKLRLQVIPHLKEINPNLENTFVENMSRFAEIESFLQIQVAQLTEQIAEQKPDGCYFSISGIKQLNPQKLLLFELLKPFHFTDSVVEEIRMALDGLSGKHFLSATHEAIINRQHLIVRPIRAAGNPNQSIHPASLSTAFGAYRCLLSYSNDPTFEAGPHKIFVDAAQLIFPLVLRNWQNGDQFKPFGMHHFKKISDFFIDEKVPLHQKKEVPVLVNGNGEVIWVAGMRQDNRYKLTKATKKVAIFELKIN